MGFQISRLCSFRTIVKVAALSKKQWPIILIGVVMCVAHGFLLPFTGYYFGQSLHVFAKSSREKAEKVVNKYAVVLVVFGVVSFFIQFLSLSLFGWAGESLTSRLRKMTFAAMMRQGLTWFQHPDNGVGSICTRFSRDIVCIHEVSKSSKRRIFATRTF